MRYPVMIHKDSDSDYGVTVPDLPGCFSGGETLDKALQYAEEAILTHIEGLLMDDENIPAQSTIEKLKNEYDDGECMWAVVSIDLNKLSDKTKRVNITIPEKILSKIDSFASAEGETRSGFLVAAALEHISLHS